MMNLEIVKRMDKGETDQIALEQGLKGARATKKLNKEKSLWLSENGYEYCLTQGKEVLMKDGKIV